MNGIIKEEFLIQKPKKVEMAKQMVRESIKIYNNKRPHLSLNYKPPDPLHKKALTLLD